MAGSDQKLTAKLVAQVGAGKNVRILTNSLIANDVAAVHGGYSRYRPRLGSVRCVRSRGCGSGSRHQQAVSDPRAMGQ